MYPTRTTLSTRGADVAKALTPTTDTAKPKNIFLIVDMFQIVDISRWQYNSTIDDKFHIVDDKFHIFDDKFHIVDDMFHIVADVSLFRNVLNSKCFTFLTMCFSLWWS